MASVYLCHILFARQDVHWLSAPFFVYEVSRKVLGQKVYFYHRTITDDYRETNKVSVIINLIIRHCHQNAVALVVFPLHVINELRLPHAHIHRREDRRVVCYSVFADASELVGNSIVVMHWFAVRVFQLNTDGSIALKLCI